MTATTEFADSRSPSNEATSQNECEPAEPTEVAKRVRHHGMLGMRARSDLSCREVVFALVLPACLLVGAGVRAGVVRVDPIAQPGFLAGY